MNGGVQTGVNQGVLQRWKGCAMCKAHKDRCFGDLVRMTSVLRKIGRSRRVTRRTIADDD